MSMAVKHRKLLIKLLLGCICVCIAPIMGVALTLFLIGVLLAVPALLLAGGGWLSWRTLLIPLLKLDTAEQVSLWRPSELESACLAARLRSRMCPFAGCCCL